MDSDEEKDTVMAAISRSRPKPLATHTLIPTRRKYNLVRMKEMLSNALGGSRGGGLFSTGDANNQNHRGYFPNGDTPTFASPAPLSVGEASGQHGDGNRKQSLMQQAVGGNRAMHSGQASASRKSSTSGTAGQ